MPKVSTSVPEPSEASARVSPRRRSRLGARLLTAVLGVLGALVLLFASWAGRRSAGSWPRGC